ncbi:hypothetical protein ABZY02_35210 [Streptomyces sp. NPDC006649]|uniref:hypothetical protein n=1 Tax=Streptomyces sp. NPDC006649 TaxID=3156896 RepID=UPI00339E76C5
MTIKVLSVAGKRMSTALLGQLVNRDPLDADGVARGRFWGRVVNPKYCLNSSGYGGWDHWHVIYDHDGELAVWRALQGLRNEPFPLVAGTPYSPESAIAIKFLDACALETIVAPRASSRARCST